jgi:16S rRNA (guanine966-N2)-methyltransferase
MRVGAGRFKSARLPAPGPRARPVPGRVRTSLFSVLAERLEGARVLDLCAGVGAFGIEAVSRGAASALLVDRDVAAVRAIERWARERGAQDVVRAVAADVLRRPAPGGPYDLVFLDPPFSAFRDGTVASFLGRAVAATAPEGLVALKAPARAAIPEDPRWRVVDRRAHGSVGYALVVPVGSGAAPS